MVHEHHFQPDYIEYIPLCHKHRPVSKHLLFVVDLVYFTLFLPLVMLPLLGWGILVALGSYRERLGHRYVN